MCQEKNILFDKRPYIHFGKYFTMYKLFVKSWLYFKLSRNKSQYYNWVLDMVWHDTYAALYKALCCQLNIFSSGDPFTDMD